PLSNVYNFINLLELLTKKTPFQDLVEEHDANIPRWVCSMWEEEWNDYGEDPKSSENKASEEKLTMLLNIMVACITIEAEKRSPMQEARAEVMFLSNSTTTHRGGGHTWCRAWRGSMDRRAMTARHLCEHRHICKGEGIRHHQCQQCYRPPSMLFTIKY
ncbi:unnamed protein product, partial [Musa hybrid cultivar]